MRNVFVLHRIDVVEETLQQEEKRWQQKRISIGVIWGFSIM